MVKVRNSETKMKYPFRIEGDESLDFVRMILEDTGYEEYVEPDILSDLSQPSDPIEWIQKEFWIPEIKGPLPLFPYQIAVLREAYRTDANGMFKYDTIIYSDIKKSAKSTIAAAVAAERARRLLWGYVRIVANSKDQAASRVFYYLERAIKLNPKLRESVKIKQYQMLFPGNTYVQAIPMNPKTQAGGNDDLIIFSELWAAENVVAQQGWTELTIPPNKHGHAQRWIETYAGFKGASPLLEGLYESGVKNGFIINLGIPGLEVYANPESKILCLWNTQPRLPWQTESYYASEAAVLTPSEFLRVHRNQWVLQEENFVPPAWWESCKQPLPEMDKYRQVVIAIDAAVSSDSFAIVAVSRHGENVAVREAREWRPPKGGKIDFTNPLDPDDPEYPEGFVRYLVRKYNVIVVVYDPMQMHLFCSKLADENLAWFKEFPQGQKRLVADKTLYDLIRDRRIMHDGNAALTEHVLNANAAQDEAKLRLVKKSKGAKIDLAVALAMACHAAFEYLAA